jgi:hypothetical protein
VNEDHGAIVLEERQDVSRGVEYYARCGDEDTPEVFAVVAFKCRCDENEKLDAYVVCYCYE